MPEDPTNHDHYKGLGPEVIQLTRQLNFEPGAKPFGT